MTTTLSEPGRDLFDQLTLRPLYVVDTEFSTHENAHHLIAIAVVPVIGGRRTRVGQELYRVMNPGVPIDAYSSTIHGFTDADVAKKRTFEHYAKVICERLSEEPDAVFVCHNTIDAHVLRAELARLDDRAAAGDTGLVGVRALPDLSIIDTQRLASTVAYPGIGRNSRLSLAKLCDLTGVARPSPAHNARADARATADALIALLRHAAEKAAFWTFEDLIGANNAGTTHTPSGPAHIGGARKRRPRLPTEHVSRHIEPLTDPVPAASPEAERWLDLAAECAALRCPYLRDEASVAASANGAVLLPALLEDLPYLAEPGQAGTLLGAVAELLTAPEVPGQVPVLAPRSALKWWKATRELIDNTAACDRTDAATCCPSCHESQPCPRDVIGGALAERATLGTHPTLSEMRVRQLLSTTLKSPANTWRKHHPEVLAYALWRVARHLLDEGHDERAFSAVDLGIAMKVHTVEPRLAELACERLIETGGTDAAFAVANQVLAQRTTDEAYDDLAEWVIYTQNALYAQQPAPTRPITHPRLARPRGDAQPRMYS